MVCIKFRWVGEIVVMLSREWNLDDAKEVWAEEKAEKIAEKMILANESIDKIIEYTELTEKKILNLKKKLKI
jgi:hypothetical protein